MKPEFGVTLFEPRVRMHSGRVEAAPLAFYLHSAAIWGQSPSNTVLNAQMLIHLIGPGGTGKTTTGRALAAALDLQFVDLDDEYPERASINDDIDQRGYEYYAKSNTTLYLELTKQMSQGVVALSSGCMLYSSDVHPEIARVHRAILASPGTVLLLPSFDIDKCVQETTKRQMERPYVKSTDEMQRGKTCGRFHQYAPMGSSKVSTDKPDDDLVHEITLALKVGA